jgi:transcriptional regulator with XRE-family HTH domain
MPAWGSTVVRRQLGRRLRSLRESAGKTREDVAVAQICSRAKLEKAEHGRIMIRPGDVRELCHFYEVDPRTTEVLAQLAYGTKDPDWWERYSATMRPDFGLYVGLEAAASALHGYEPEVIHGLLQTPDYARAVELATRLDATTAVIERNVELRMERQRTVLGAPSTLRLEVVLGECALRRAVEPAGVLPAQIQHLHRVARRDHVDIRVLPLMAGQVPAMLGAFSVLDFTDPADPPVAYVETYGGAHYPEEPAQVEQYRRRFAVVRERSVPIQEYSP